METDWIWVAMLAAVYVGANVALFFIPHGKTVYIAGFLSAFSSINAPMWVLDISKPTWTKVVLLALVCIAAGYISMAVYERGKRRWEQKCLTCERS